MENRDNVRGDGDALQVIKDAPKVLVAQRGPKARGQQHLIGTIFKALMEPGAHQPQPAPVILFFRAIVIAPARRAPKHPGLPLRDVPQHQVAHLKRGKTGHGRALDTAIKGLGRGEG